MLERKGDALRRIAVHLSEIAHEPVVLVDKDILEEAGSFLGPGKRHDYDLVPQVDVVRERSRNDDIAAPLLPFHDEGFRAGAVRVVDE